MSGPVDIPLFPLNVVLVPDGHLPLRIFERRYLDMVRECTSGEKPFGVVLVVQAGEADQPAAHVRVGTDAHIRDFHTLDDGLLGIIARGGRKFTIQSTRARDDGLLLGTVTYAESEPDTPLPPEYSLLADIIHGFIDKVGGDYPSLAEPRLDDATWVGYRLTELLPLDAAEKQALLEIEQPLVRLQALVDVLPRFQAGEGDE